MSSESVKLKKVNLSEKFKLFSDHWSPKIAGELNDSYVKLAKFSGEFVWHKHDHEDELFFVVQGELTIEIENEQPMVLKPGEFGIIPKGVMHKPVAPEEVHVMLIEPKATLNTGDAQSDKTVKDLDRI